MAPSESPTPSSTHHPLLHRELPDVVAPIDRGKIRIFENPAAIPRAYLVPAVKLRRRRRRQRSDRSPTLRSEPTPRSDRRRGAAVRERSGRERGRRQRDDQLVRAGTGDDHDVVERARLLAVTDAFAPGWVATVDRTRRASMARELPVPRCGAPGGVARGHVHLPGPGLSGGTIAAFCALVVLAGVPIATRSDSRRRRKASDASLISDHGAGGRRTPHCPQPSIVVHLRGALRLGSEEGGGQPGEARRVLRRSLEGFRRSARGLLSGCVADDQFIFIGHSRRAVCSTSCTRSPRDAIRIISARKATKHDENALRETRLTRSTARADFSRFAAGATQSPSRARTSRVVPRFWRFRETPQLATDSMMLRRGHPGKGDRNVHDRRPVGCVCPRRSGRSSSGPLRQGGCGG